MSGRGLVTPAMDTCTMLCSSQMRCQSVSYQTLSLASCAKGETSLDWGTNLPTVVEEDMNSPCNQSLS